MARQIIRNTYLEEPEVIVLINDRLPVVSKAAVGLSNADNTSDIDKPVSTATQNALNDKSDDPHTHLYADIEDAPTLGNAAAADTTDFATAGQGALADTSSQIGHTHSVSDLTATGIKNGTRFLRDDNTWQIPAGGGGGGSGLVDSVNTKTGDVTLTTDDVPDAGATAKYVTASDVANLANLGGINTGDQDLSLYAELTDLSAYSPASHTHDIDDLTPGGGTKSASTYLNGQGNFSTPPNTNTTYPVINQGTIDSGLSVTSQTISGQAAQMIVVKAQTTVPAPSVDAHAANKKYVDDEILGVTNDPQVPSDWNAVAPSVARILSKPVLGTAAAKATTDFATSVQGGKADTASQPGHTHTQAQVTGLVSKFDDYYTKIAVDNLFNAFDVGISDVTGLTSELAGKASVYHTHAQSQVSGLGAALAGKAPTSHGHAGEQITAGTISYLRIPAGSTSSTFSVGNHKHGPNLENTFVVWNYKTTESSVLVRVAPGTDHNVIGNSGVLGNLVSRMNTAAISANGFTWWFVWVKGLGIGWIASLYLTAYGG